MDLVDSTFDRDSSGSQSAVAQDPLIQHVLDGGHILNDTAHHFHPAIHRRSPQRTWTLSQDTTARKKPMFFIAIPKSPFTLENYKKQGLALTPPTELRYGSRQSGSVDHSDMDSTPLPLDENVSSGRPGLDAPSNAPSRQNSLPYVVARSLQLTDRTLLEAVKIAVQSLHADHQKTSSFKVVSQILPCPAQEALETSEVGQDSSSITINTLIDSLRTLAEGSKWIYVIHALPERSGVKEMPTSPPTTPGMGPRSHGQEDYFNSGRVISNVSIMIDRHDTYNNQGRLVADAPGLVTPPSTSDISLYQRLIPPSTIEEFRDLFSLERPSALVDRLSELAPMGNLIFIYPTKVGAETFQQRYLNPQLDSTIRNVVYRNDLPPSVCATLSWMASAPHMLGFEDLEKQLECLISQVERKDPSSGPMFTTVFSRKCQLQVLDRTWKQWWVQQEASRIKQVMEACIQKTTIRPRYKDEQIVTARSLVREMLDGLLAHDSSKNAELSETELHSRGIEVGIFVVKRIV